MRDEAKLVSRRAVLGSSLAMAALPRAVAMGVGVSMDLMREPDLVRAFAGADAVETVLQARGGRWVGGGVTVEVEQSGEGLALFAVAEGVPLHRVHVRWRLAVAADASVLGDAWERSYGDLAWLPLQPERVMPWYCLVSTRQGTFGAGVKTGGGALAFWQVDAEGVSLWLDVRCGGNGVELGARRLAMATVVQASAVGPGTSWAATVALCKAMARGVEVPRRRGGYDLRTVYGSNDWYYAYGRNTPAGIVRDAALMRECAPAGSPQPFTVVDDGYQNAKVFPSMARLAEAIRAVGVAPGVWIRPLRAGAGEPAGLLLPAKRGRDGEAARAFDPTVPEARERVLRVVTEACGWGYDFLKHDFTTYELLGQWGFSMGASPTVAGWSFHDRTQTNAEVIRGLYVDIRKRAGPDRIVLGCNTVGHLAVGLFDLQRTGDDVSGRSWERTRRMGVNTLAFRLPQNRIFFGVDADCVPITPEVPWVMTERWLDAVAASGSVLLVSADPRAVGPEQKAALRRAFAVCAAGGGSEPLDWATSRTPAVWQTTMGRREFEWLPAEGASPFVV